MINTAHNLITLHILRIMSTSASSWQCQSGHVPKGLADGLRQADDDDTVRVILICGSDDCFTSGNDLADFYARPTGLDSPVMQFLIAISEARSWRRSTAWRLGSVSPRRCTAPPYA